MEKSCNLRIILKTGKENLRLGQGTVGNRIHMMKYNELKLQHWRKGPELLLSMGRPTAINKQILIM